MGLAPRLDAAVRWTVLGLLGVTITALLTIAAVAGGDPAGFSVILRFEGGKECCAFGRRLDITIRAESLDACTRFRKVLVSELRGYRVRADVDECQPVP